MRAERKEGKKSMKEECQLQKKRDPAAYKANYPKLKKNFIGKIRKVERKCRNEEKKKSAEEKEEVKK